MARVCPVCGKPEYRERTMCVQNCCNDCQYLYDIWGEAIRLEILDNRGRPKAKTMKLIRAIEAAYHDGDEA
jgi:hypothetical protein